MENLDIRVAPSAVASYQREIELDATDRGAHLAITRLVEDRLRAGRPADAKTDADGARIWRCGFDKVYVHVFEYPALIEVVRVRKPHAGWKPRKGAAPVDRPVDLLGSELRRQRERQGLGVELSPVWGSTWCGTSRGTGPPCARSTPSPGPSRLTCG